MIIVPSKTCQKNNRLFCKDTNVFHMMQTVLIHLFGYSIFSFRKMTFNELKVVVRECQFPMLFVLQHIQSETQKHVTGAFPSAESDETLYVIVGTYSKCLTIPFISDALDWHCGDGCKFSHAHESFMLMPNKQSRRKMNKKVVFKQNIDTSKHRKRKTNKEMKEDNTSSKSL